MSKTDYLPIEEIKLIKWFESFIIGLESVASALDLTTDEINQVKDDHKMLKYAVEAVMDAKAMKQSYVAFKDILKDGNPNEEIKAFPVFPTIISPTVTTPKNGILKRTRMFVRRIKTHEKYNEPMGALLGVIKERYFDPSAFQPRIKLTSIAEGVMIRYTKSHTDGVNIYRRFDGSEEWKLIGRDNYPPYIDIKDFEGHRTIQYRVRSIINDVEIGMSSQIATIVI